MCLAQGPQHSDAGGLELAAPQSRVKHSTTEPLRSHIWEDKSSYLSTENMMNGSLFLTMLYPMAYLPKITCFKKYGVNFRLENECLRNIDDDHLYSLIIHFQVCNPSDDYFLCKTPPMVLSWSFQNIASIAFEFI